MSSILNKNFGQCIICDVSDLNIFFYCESCMPTWISINDKFPPYNETILVKHDNQISLAFIELQKKKFIRIGSWKDDYHELFTHWMPVPVTD